MHQGDPFYYRLPMLCSISPSSVIPLIRFFFIDIYKNLQIECKKLSKFLVGRDYSPITLRISPISVMDLRRFFIMDI